MASKSRLRRIWPIAALSVVITSCAGVPAQHAAATAPATVVEQTIPPGLLLEIHWFRDSAEMEAAYAQAYRLAEAQIRQLSKDIEIGTRWGVVIDVDETLLDNSEFMKRFALRRFVRPELKFTDDEFNDWAREQRAPALPGAAEFLQAVHSLGGRVVAVSNRDQRVCEETASNLKSQRLKVDLVLCKVNNNRDKNPRFALAEAGDQDLGIPPQRTILYVGDNIQDFPGLTQASAGDQSAFGTRFIVLPNPMYGSWEDKPRK